jgi:RNA polymerase sigma factor (sigma-70 family)
MEYMTDADLILAARAGDRGAFAVLIDRHRPLLIALCRRTLRDTLAAEDAAHEAILQAMLSLDRLRRPDRFGPWLAGIGLNLCRRMLASRDGCWSLDAVYGGRHHAEVPAERCDPADLAVSAEFTTRVHAAVATLPPGQRAAILLFYLSGLTLAETAATLRIEIGAVKTRLHKARKSLRAQLSNEWKEYTMTVDSDTAMIEMQVEGVRFHPGQGETPRNGVAVQHIVVLKEGDTDRRLLIWVGQPEAMAIAIYHQGLETPRPMTYAFLGAILDALGGRLEGVHVSRLADEVFYAEAVISTPQGRKSIDARPSDAIALALSQKVPIRVDPAVLEQAAVTGPHEKAPDSKWLRVVAGPQGFTPEAADTPAG